MSPNELCLQLQMDASIAHLCLLAVPIAPARIYVFLLWFFCCCSPAGKAHLSLSKSTDQCRRTRLREGRESVIPADALSEAHFRSRTKVEQARPPSPRGCQFHEQPLKNNSTDQKSTLRGGVDDSGELKAHPAKLSLSPA